MQEKKQKKSSIKLKLKINRERKKKRSKIRETALKAAGYPEIWIQFISYCPNLHQTSFECSFPVTIQITDLPLAEFSWMCDTEDQI